jgi:cob(I)alamin adenosyltransferase
VKIYTGTGDKGKTSLFSGERVPKFAQRVEAYGDVDELNSVLGELIAILPEELQEPSDEIRGIQSDLLHAGGWLAVTPDSPSTRELQEITEEHIKKLENAIERMESGLPDLKGFLLPGGHISAAKAHVARSVCRRAERHVVKLLDGSDQAESSDQLRRVITYLNRLSDYLFVLARQLNRLHGVHDELWKK